VIAVRPTRPRGRIKPCASLSAVMCRYLPVSGFQGGVGSLLVALKQLVPDNEVALLRGLFRFRARHLAGAYVAMMAGVGVVTGTALQLAGPAVFGAYCGWAYLRFAQLQPDTGLRWVVERRDLSLAFFFLS
jgi:hypothetical protein